MVWVLEFQIGTVMPIPEFPQYLCVKDVANILKVKEKFVYKHQKEIPGYLRVAGKPMFDADILYKELKKLASARALTNT